MHRRFNTSIDANILAAKISLLQANGTNDPPSSQREHSDAELPELSERRRDMSSHLIFICSTLLICYN